MTELKQFRFSDEASVMRRALELAERGLGAVEPNPAVGAVIVDDNLNWLGEGYHDVFGGPHAEIHAIRSAGDRVPGSTIFVTLEPCCHTGKTPPCSRALIDAGFSRVVVALRDPAPYVNGGGISELRQAGIRVDVGLLGKEAAIATAPFLKRVTTGLPFVHGKWAMTLDGKIATRTGQSQWLSNEASREQVHRLRGRMDALLVGARTAKLDDPLLTARPAGFRTPVRIVIDRELTLSTDARLFRTIDQAPVLLVGSATAAAARGELYRSLGAEVFSVPTMSDDSQKLDLHSLMSELGRRQMTNVMVEGGGGLLGTLFDQQLIDQVHVYLTPKLIGGQSAVTPIAGTGLELVPRATQFVSHRIEEIDGDVYWTGLLSSPWWQGVEAQLDSPTS